MKAELSSVVLQPARHFSGVYQQQGRMLVDRDWNELTDILRHLGTEIGSQAIGTGVPRHGGLIAQSTPPDALLTLRNEGGLVAAAGVIAEVRPRSPRTDVSIYQNQLDLPEQVRASSSSGDSRSQQRSPEGKVLYIDVWERTVTAFESDDLVDPALHGADTCFRTQRMAQIKSAIDKDLDTHADPCLPGFLPERIADKGNAVFDAKLTPAGDAPDPCDPCAEQVTIARSVTNHLFRVEVHSVEFDAERRPIRLLLKWSRDNGARELRLTEFATMGDPAGHSYEYFSDATERLLGMPSDDWVGEAFLRGVLDPADPLQISGVLPRIREWDGWCGLDRNGDNWSITDGRYLATKFDAGARINIAAAPAPEGRSPQLGPFVFPGPRREKIVLAGDYWLAVVRTRAPKEPTDKRVRVVSPTPIGVEHRYCILSIAAADGSAIIFKQLSAYDLRRLQHPSLTCLDASDISYATDCPSGLFNAGHDTVKKALDQICRIRADQVAFGKPCDTSVYGSRPRTNQDRGGCAKLLCTSRRSRSGSTAVRLPCATEAKMSLPPSMRCASGRGKSRSARHQGYQLEKRCGDEVSAFRNGLSITFSEAMVGRAPKYFYRVLLLRGSCLFVCVPPMIFSPAFRW